MNDFLGGLAIAIAIVSYSVYIAHTLQGYTKPHAISWLIWALLHGFVFFEQVEAGAGPGAWVTGASAIVNLFIFFLALFKGERRIVIFDWFCLLLVFGLFYVWSSLADPSVAIGTATVIVIIGFIPTVRKSLRNPHEETATTFALNSVKFLIALFALSTVTLTTALYPATLFVLNGAFAVYLLVVRHHHKAKKGASRGTKSTRRR